MQRGRHVQRFAGMIKASKGETNMKELETGPENDQNDIKGPINLVLKAEKGSADSKSKDKSKLIVYGSVDNILDDLTTTIGNGVLME